MTHEQHRVWHLLLEYLRGRTEHDGNPVHIDEAPEEMPPLVRARFNGETRDFTTIWYSVGTRTLRFETYVLPSPEDNHEAVYRFLLRRNRRLYLSSFEVDADGDIYLAGRLPLEAVTPVEVDRVTGQLYQAVEQTFRPLLRLAYPRRFA